jgi:ATP-dependent Zn protease
MMDLQATATHEAGHAVAAVRLEIEYGTATIVPDEKTGTLGAVSCDDRYYTHQEEDGLLIGTVSQELVEKQFILCFAGYAALIAAGHSEEEALSGTGQDISDAEQLLELVPSAPLEHWKEEAVALMKRPENINAVRRVANQLIKDCRLLADMIDVLVEVADGNCTEADYERFVSIHPSGQWR